MTDSASRDAHAETNAHHASVCKACAMSCATDMGALCHAAERLKKLETSVKRLRIAILVILIALLLFLAFLFGQRTQSHGNQMQPGPMRGIYVNPDDFKGMTGNPNSNVEVFIERYEIGDDDGRNQNDENQNDDRYRGRPRKNMKNNDNRPPQPPAPPLSNT